jgi:hypothetical protein
VVDDGLGCQLDRDLDGYDEYAGDCDDFDDSVYPFAPELCDGADQDCDGLPAIDEVDDDFDGILLCDGDCDDLDPTIYPGAVEACDAVDSDCDLDFQDGALDFDGDGLIDCVDPDADGDSDPNGTDCAPMDPSISSFAIESCDAVDQDCDGSLVDEFPDTDSDLDPDCVDPDDDGDLDPDVQDCDDADPAVYTGAAEGCDLADSDCDGSLLDGYPDWDGDLLPDCVDPDDDGDFDPDSSDCADFDPNVSASAPEACDEIDSNCNGSLVDGYPDCDGDGTPDCVDPDDDDDGDPDGTDCDDCNAARSSLAAEVCDGVDQNCNSAPDDGVLVTYFADADGDGAGDPSATVSACAAPPNHVGNGSDCDDAAAFIAPGLTMLPLVELYSTSNQDHLTTRYLGAEYLSLTGSGQYCDVPISQPNCQGTPWIVGWSVEQFAAGQRGANAQTPAGPGWAQLRRAWSVAWADHIAHTQASLPGNSSQHGHGCSPSCPSYVADGIYLGWLAEVDLAGYTRHFTRMWKASTTNHRMSQSASDVSSLLAAGFIEDDAPGWVFNADYSCP